MKYKVVTNAFFGIRIAVAIIIIRTAYNLIVNELKNNNKVLIISLFVLDMIIVDFINLSFIN